MKKSFCLISIFLSLSVSAAPLPNGSVLDSSGVVDELLSVSFSMALTRAIEYYRTQETPLPDRAYENTIKAVSSVLNSKLSLSKYPLFNGLSYANLFLNSGVVKSSSFNAVSVASGFSGVPASLLWVTSLSSDVYYSGDFGNPSLTNPLPLISYKSVSDTQISTGVTRFVSSYNQDVFSYAYNNGYIVSGSAEDIVDFLINLVQVTVYNEFYLKHAAREKQLLGKTDKNGALIYSHCTLTTDTDKSLIPSGMNEYSVNDSPVTLPRSYTFSLMFRGNSVCIATTGFQDSISFSSNAGTGSNSLIRNNAPFYQNFTNKLVFSPFLGGDDILKNAYLSSLQSTPLLASAFSLLLNSAWVEAAAAADYQGVPYTSSLSLSSADISHVMNERELNPTYSDLFVQVKDGQLHLMQWDDTQNAYISNEMVSKQESVKVDFGPDPGIQSPELEDVGTIDKILSPITSVMPFLQKFELTTHVVQCPVINIPFYDKTYSMDSFCILAEANKKLIALFFVICWTMLGLIILVR
ncbi:hypothetical protein [Citrobacter meridianamericanus]|uniref:hypothetical protein n=1 Tax=Citrobacter meridianamericanus TaxID=2894201 RepID=UPI00351D44B4